jgi:hypothetical protein
MRGVGLGTVLASALLGLAACGETISSDGGGSARWVDDKFKPHQQISSEPVHMTGPWGRLGMALLARRDRTTGSFTTHAVVSVAYNGTYTRQYEEARSASTELLAFRQLVHTGAGCQKAGGCPHSHTFEIAVPEAALRKALAASDGYPIKMFARTGEATLFPITAGQVRTLLQAIDAKASTGNAQADARRG